MHKQDYRPLARIRTKTSRVICRSTNKSTATEGDRTTIENSKEQKKISGEINRQVASGRTGLEHYGGD
jgi:hypothetical protein